MPTAYRVIQFMPNPARPLRIPFGALVQGTGGIEVVTTNPLPGLEIVGRKESSVVLQMIVERFYLAKAGLLDALHRRILDGTPTEGMQMLYVGQGELCTICTTPLTSRKPDSALLHSSVWYRSKTSRMSPLGCVGDRASPCRAGVVMSGYVGALLLDLDQQAKERQVAHLLRRHRDYERSAARLCGLVLLFLRGANKGAGYLPFVKPIPYHMVKKKVLVELETMR